MSSLPLVANFPLNNFFHILKLYFSSKRRDQVSYGHKMEGKIIRLWFSGMWRLAIWQVRTNVTEKSIVCIFSVDWYAYWCRCRNYAARSGRNYYFRLLPRRLDFLPYALSNLADRCPNNIFAVISSIQRRRLKLILITTYNLVDLHQISEKYIASVFKMHIMHNLFHGIQTLLF
jgi:hypothetical protein